MQGLLPLPSFLRATATDAANMQMRKACRSKWSRADFNLAVEKLERLTATFFGEGDWGRYRFQVAEQMQRAGQLTSRMSMVQMHAAIDAVIGRPMEVAA